MVVLIKETLTLSLHVADDSTHFAHFGFFGTAAAETRDVWGSEMLYHKSGSPTHLQLVNPTTLSLVGTVYITFIPFTWQWHDNILVQQGLLDIVPNSNIKEWRYPYLGLGRYDIWLTCWFEWTGKEWHCTKWICLESSNMSSHFGSAKDVFLAWFARISSFTASHNTGSGRRSLGCKERCGAVNGQGWIFPLKKWTISPILPFYPSDSTKMQNYEIFEPPKNSSSACTRAPAGDPGTAPAFALPVWHCVAPTHWAPSPA